MKGHGQGAVLKAEEKMCPMCKRKHGVYTVQME